MLTNDEMDQVRSKVAHADTTWTIGDGVYYTKRLLQHIDEIVIDYDARRETLRQLNGAACNQIAMLREEVADLVDAAHAKTEPGVISDDARTIQALGRRIAKLAKENEELTGKLDGNQDDADRIANLKAHITGLKTDKDQLNAQLNGQKQNIALLEGQVRSGDDKVVALMVTVDKLRAELVDAGICLEARDEEISRLIEGLEHCADAGDVLTQESSVGTMADGRLVLFVPKPGWNHVPDSVASHDAGVTMIYSRKVASQTKDAADDGSENWEKKGQK